MNVALHSLASFVSKPENENKKIALIADAPAVAHETFFGHTVEFLFYPTEREGLDALLHVLRKNFGAHFAAQAFSPQQIEQIGTRKSLLKRVVRQAVEDQFRSRAPELNQKLSAIPVDLSSKTPEQKKEETPQEGTAWHDFFVDHIKKLSFGALAAATTREITENSLPYVNKALKGKLQITLPEEIKRDPADMTTDRVKILLLEGEKFLNKNISCLIAAQEGIETITAALASTSKKYPSPLLTECYQTAQSITSNVLLRPTKLPVVDITEEARVIDSIIGHAKEVSLALRELHPSREISENISIQENHIIADAAKKSVNHLQTIAPCVHESLARIKELTTFIEEPSHSNLAAVWRKPLAACAKRCEEAINGFQEIVTIMDSIISVTKDLLSPETIPSTESPETSLEKLKTKLQETLSSIEDLEEALQEDQGVLAKMKRNSRM